MTREQLLLQAIEFHEDIREDWEKILISSPSLSNIKDGSESLWFEYERYALKSYFVDKDINAAKQHFYTCGKLDEVAIKLGSAILDYGMIHFANALLSDNKELILSYASLSHKGFQENVLNGNSTPMYILQCIVKDDWAEFERAMPIMQQKSFKLYDFKLDFMFYEAVAEKNLVKCESVLNDFLLPEVFRKRSVKLIASQNFLYHPVIGYAKLAWFKNLQVNINHKLIPNALLPIQPNEGYTNEYDFLLKI